MKKRSGKNVAMRTPSKDRHPAGAGMRKRPEPVKPKTRDQLLRAYLDGTKSGTPESRAALDAIISHDNSTRFGR